MSEKRFKSTIDEDTMSIMPYLVSDKEEECFYNLEGCVDLLNEQQSEINSLKMELELISGEKLFSRRELERKVDEQQATIRKLQDLCGKSDGENAKLRIENKKLKAKLKEKEEDEQLYANEILELRETNKEWLQFKSLGGDY